MTTALAQTAPAGPPPSIADFFRVPALYRPVMSPDNRYVAAAFGGPDGHKRLGVFNLAKPEESKIIASFSDVDVDDYQWVNNDRLVLSVGDSENPDRRLFPGLWAVSRDGSDFRQLIQAEFSIVVEGSGKLVDRRLRAEWSLHGVLRDGSDDVLVQAPIFNGAWEVIGSKLARLDTRTGISRNLSFGVPDHVSSWVVDRQGAPAAVTTWDQGRYASYLKTANGWQLWEAGNGYTGSFAEPYWIGPKGELLALAQRGAGTDALFQVDRASLKLADQPTISMAGYDFRSQPVYDSVTEHVLGWRYESDAHGTVWLDAGMKAMQAEIDKQLPATANEIVCENCSGATTVIVNSRSDRQPPIYYLYTPKTQAWEVLGTSRPQIKPAQMGLRDMYRFEARDGLTIPVLVTQPAGKATGPRPAVVLVHGGPWVRGAHWEWERDAQFLASRGYVVIEPEFRGSTGYGHNLYRAGWKQWGLAMQDDVADATQWAVKQGWVDPKRVCIAGASYGGYATLMGLIQSPELYQCGFQWVGVSDINLMYTIAWSDLSTEWQRYGMPVLIGDRVKDAQQLKETSPLEQASRLKRPLLMAYGGNDRRVPAKHGSAFRDAASKSGAPIEWIEYPDEGHGWRKLKTNVDFWTRVEKFLDRNIGPGSIK